MAVVGAPRSAREQDGFEVGEGGLVDLAGEGDDGADGLGEGLAGAGDRLLHAVEEAALLLGWFGGGRSSGEEVGWSGCCSVCRVCRRERMPC